MRRRLILSITLALVFTINSVVVIHGNTFSQDEVQINPNAPQDYDANLKSGDMAIGVGERESLEKIRIESKSGGVYRATNLESPNPYAVYYRANSVYPYFDYDKLNGLVNDYRDALEPYIDCYSSKHGVDIEKLKGDGFRYDISWSNEKELKTRLESELPKLAQLESRLRNELRVFPNTYLDYAQNPAVVHEIATQRTAYFQCVTNKKVSLRAEESVWLMAHRDGIRKVQKQVDEYDPATKSTMATYSEYALYAVSPKEREKWLRDKNAMEFKENVDALLAPLAAALAKRLPTYIPKLYTVRNAAEEAMMKRVLTNPARYKIYGIGLEQSAWLVGKNSLGIPTARYKHGMIYLRDSQSDHPYCFATYVNIIQDYTGGGTYGASYPKIVQDDLVGCPSGK